MQRILLIDNFDSFTYNLSHYLEELGADVVVRRNDRDVNDWPLFDGVVISPGPGLPEDAGICMEFLGHTVGKIPILGVCLGMQCLAQHLGDELYNLNAVRHGVEMHVKADGTLFTGCAKGFNVGLYHSWAIRGDGKFEVVSRSAEGVVMAIENPELKIFGVQFHPDSVMTPEGKRILRNFLNQLESFRFDCDRSHSSG